KRVKQMLLSSSIFNHESVHALADSIARGVTVGDLEYLRNYLPRILAVTAEQIQQAAKKYFKPDEAVVVWSVPKPPKEGKDSGARGQGSGDAVKARPPLHRAHRLTAFDKPSGQPFSLKNAERVELPNGLVLLLLEDHRLPIVAAQAYVRHVD